MLCKTNLTTLGVLSMLLSAALSAGAQEGVGIKPYTGPAVYLDEGEAPPEPIVVSEREKATQKYENGNVRFEREVAKYSDNSFVNNGSYKEYYESGKLFVEGAFKLGVRVGGWTFYHENGQVAKKVTYIDGLPDGKVEIRRVDGTLSYSREYSLGKRVGEWLTYDASGEKRVREEHYVDGKNDGVWKTWYDNGKPWRETSFKDGKRHGVAKEWNDDGTPRLTAEFKEGLRDGPSVEWNRDGEKRERQFSKGKIVVGQ